MPSAPLPNCSAHPTPPDGRAMTFPRPNGSTTDLPRAALPARGWRIHRDTEGAQVGKKHVSCEPRRLGLPSIRLFVLELERRSGGLEHPPPAVIRSRYRSLTEK